MRFIKQLLLIIDLCRSYIGLRFKDSAYGFNFFSQRHGRAQAIAVNCCFVAYTVHI